MSEHTRPDAETAGTSRTPESPARARTADGWAHAAFRAAARLRGAPALHPDGVLADGRLDVVGGDGRRPWDVEWLDRPARYPVTARWSRAMGLPRALPDAYGLAVRVHDAGGAGRPLDLLFTTSGSGRRARHLPLVRRTALTGPYSSLLAHRVGGRLRVLTAVPRPLPGHRRLPGDPRAVSRALADGTLVFHLRAAGRGENWRTFAVLTLENPRDAAPGTTLGYDIYAHHLPGLEPGPRFAAVRRAAYAGSRRGRTGSSRTP
ncbi:phosphodiesterase [Streptomyces sp. URMC 126]|uniref:phosphodiesterase n=1 Tax=Streptomyces sp. URMC 126 TaxID=3423401 RepID=UPI003F1E057D